MEGEPASAAKPRSEALLTGFAWLSVGAALVTMALKVWAWRVTDSVGLLSDATESLVNLAAALATLFALRVSHRPPNRNHPFGHSKAEYFSAALEGQLILIAAAAILYASTMRLLSPAPLQRIDLGLGLSILSSVVNGGVAWVLLRAARRHRSIALRADARHLLADVWTSVGVVVGVTLASVTGLDWLDPVVALLVGLHVLWTGWSLLRESLGALLDQAWAQEERDRLVRLLSTFQTDETKIHGLRTRASGQRSFVEFHVLVPGEWSVMQGHDHVEKIETVVRAAFSGVEIVSHLEPLEDPRSYDDYSFEDPVPRPSGVQHAAVSRDPAG